MAILQQYNENAIKTAKESVTCTLNRSDGKIVSGTLTNDFGFSVAGEWVDAMKLSEPTGIAGILFQIAKLKGSNINALGGPATNKIFNGGNYPTIPLSIRIYGRRCLGAARLLADSCLPQNSLNGDFGLRFVEDIATAFTDNAEVAALNVALELGTVATQAALGKNRLLNNITEAAETLSLTYAMFNLATGANPGQHLWNIEVGDIFKYNGACLDSVNYAFSSNRTIDSKTGKAIPLYVDFDLSFSTREIPLAGNISNEDNSNFYVGGNSNRVTVKQ